MTRVRSGIAKNSNYCYDAGTPPGINIMNFSLPPAMESFIRKQVKSGRYGNASEVVREGLRLLMHEMESRQKKLEALRGEIQKGLESGPARDLDIQDIIATAQKRREAKQRKRA
jgi:antitoxin ParD1/3/4